MAVLYSTNSKQKYRYCCTSAWVPVIRKNQEDDGIPPASSDDDNQAHQYCACRCIAHARRVGGSVVTVGSVRLVCCVPGICLGCALTAYADESLRKTTDTILPVTTCKIRSLVLKTGKLSYPFPQGNKVERLATRSRWRGSRPDLDPRVRPGFLCRVLSVSPQSACTKRHDRKSTEKSYP